jgi:hypothetical protein
MHPAGYWVEPGSGYLPKYRSTVWSLSLLAQLGARVEEDDRIATACQYFLNEAFAPGGQIASKSAPSGTVDCLQGNMLWALLELGWMDEQMEHAFDWMARTVTGEGIAPISEKKADRRYYAGKCGPNFECGANNKLPCAWGAVKVMLAFSALPRHGGLRRSSRLCSAASPFYSTATRCRRVTPMAGRKSLPATGGSLVSRYFM